MRGTKAARTGDMRCRAGVRMAGKAGGREDRNC